MRAAVMAMKMLHVSEYPLCSIMLVSKYPPASAFFHLRTRNSCMIPNLIRSHFSDEYGSSRRRERNDDFASEGVDLNFSGDSSGSASASEQVPVKLAFPGNTFDGGSKGKGGEKRQPRQVSTGEQLHLRSTSTCDSLTCPSPLHRFLLLMIFPNGMKYEVHSCNWHHTLFD